MQANEYVGLGGSRKRRSKTLHLWLADISTGAAGLAAVDVDDSPVTKCQVFAVVESGSIERLAHQFTNVVIAGYAVNGQTEVCQQRAKPLISFGRIVLNNISGDQRNVSWPGLLANVIENTDQGVLCFRAAQVAVFAGEEVRVGKVQYPNLISGVSDWPASTKSAGAWGMHRLMITCRQ